MDGAKKHVDQAGLFAYRPAIDGLRTVAVVAVMLYHGAQLTGNPIDPFPGGFLGVDLFFVLSGFLITTLLLVEWRSTTGIRFKNFWIRRARRLLPALLLVVTAVAITFLFADALRYGASEIKNFRNDALSSLFYAANWRFAFSGQSYFDQFGGPSPLRHMWSLAIEEQFYLVWPVLLYVGLKVLRLSRRTFAIIIMIGAWASALAMALAYKPGTDPSLVYYGTHTRAQAMLVGAFVAFVLVGIDRERLRAQWVQAAGIVGLAGCFLMFRIVHEDPQISGWMYQGGFMLMAVLAAFAIIAASGPQDTPYTKALSWKPLVWLGTLSYGLYLWHWPIFVVLDSELTGLNGIRLLALRFAVTLGVACASYYLVEKPIRFGALAERRPRWIALAGTAAAAALIVSTMVLVKPPADALETLTDDEIAKMNINTTPVQPGDLKVLLVGDSVAQSLGYYRPSPLPGYAVQTAAIIGCGVVRGNLVPIGKPKPAPRPQCDDWPKLWQAMKQKFDPDVSVLVIGAWEIFDHEVNGKLMSVGSPAYENYLLSELETGHDILTADGTPMVILTSECFKVLKPGSQSDWVERNDTGRVDWVNSVIQKFAKRHPEDVTLLDLHGFVCPDGSYVGEIDGVKLHEDGTHFTREGAPVVWDWLVPQLEPFRPADSGAGAGGGNGKTGNGKGPASGN